MLQKLLLGVILVFVGILPALAQQKTVTGRVTDSQGNGVAGVTVTVRGSRTATQTAADGSYSLSTPETATLIFTSVGFTSQQVNVTGKTTVDASLATSNSSLNEVIVTGYGTTGTRKKDLTGAVSSITTKDFNRGVINSPDQLLQNKVAGLEVTNTSGQPGAATTVQIRGSSSIRAGAAPLYVVDGVILDGGTARPGFSTLFGSTPNSDPLVFINPYDIAQVDVLKDASSTAIYGSRGANGVILITTKKGGSGPMKIDIGANASDFAGYMKRFEILSRSEFLAATNKYTLNEDAHKNDSLKAAYNGGQDVDALKEITQSKITQNYSVALSGGNESGKFRASFLASSNNGFIKKSSLKKYLASFNGQYNFLDNRLNVDFGVIAANFGESLVPIGGNSGSTGSLVSAALQWDPTFPFKINGKYNYPSSGSGNPLAESDAFNDNTTVSEFLAHFSAAYKILPNLQYKFLYGLNYGTGIRYVNEDGWLQGFPGVSGQGFAGILNQELFTQIFDHTLDYNAKITKDFSIDALVGYEFYKRDLRGGGVSGSGFNTNIDETDRIPSLYTNNISNAKTQNPAFTFVDPTSQLQSFFARVVLNFQDKYLLTGTFRADGSSKFGENNRYGYFPSGAFKWQISNENFMKDNKVFSNLGVRVSYGGTGNQEFPSGASKEQFALGSYNNINQVVNGNPDLQWETSKQFDGGVDFAFSKGRVSGSIDYYNRNTSKILFATNAIQPAPNSTSYINLPDAHLVNSGIEGFLSVTAIENKKITWDITTNIAYNKNKVTKFTDPNSGKNLLINTGTINGQGVSGTLAQVFANNKPVNVYYLKHFSGFDQSGNQIVSDNPDFAGDPNPSVIAGISSSIRYEKLTLSINFGGSFGFKIYNNTATSVTNLAGIVQGRNVDKNAYNSQEKPSSGAKASDRFLENGNYVKLRNATFSYNIGNIGKYFKNANAYVTGSNLFVLTKFSGFDPEVNIDKSNNGYPSRSIEYIPYPTPRIITVGVNFSL